LELPAYSFMPALTAARLAREALALDALMLVTIDHSAQGDELWG
jgi:hypothetical protein